jgi:hypothetical protein
MLAFGKDAVLNKIRRPRGLVLCSLGGTAFLFLAVWGFIGTRAPGEGKSYFDIFNTAYAPLTELSIALMMGAGLLVIFLALVLLTGAKEEQ